MTGISIETLFYSAKIIFRLSLSRSFFFLCSRCLNNLFCYRSFSFLYGRSLNGSLFNDRSGSVLSNNSNGNLHLYLLVEVDDSLILTYLLGFLHGDNLTIYLDALFSKSLNHLSRTNRTIELTCNGNLGSNLQSYALESLCLVFGSSLLSSQLVSLLLQVLS